MMQLKRTNNSLGRQILIGAILATFLGNLSARAQAAEFNLDTNSGLEQAVLENETSDSCTEEEVLLSKDDIESLSAGQIEDANFGDFIVQTQETVCAVGGVGAPAAVGSETLPTLASGGRFPYEILGLLIPPLLFLPGSDGGSNPSPPKPVPEPSTILGSGMALGFGLLLQRSRSKKHQKTK